MNIDKPTYLIAELGGDVVELVRSMRQRFNPNNVLWPADITIAGSSGVGTLKDGQSLDHIIETITPIVSELKFKNVEFIEVGKFPDTGIYFLKPERDQFDKMHKSIISSGLEFNESPWPYNPHCTLHWKDKSTAELDEYFNSIEIPKNSVVECFSLYQPEKIGGTRAYEF